MKLLEVMSIPCFLGCYGSLDILCRTALADLHRFDVENNTWTSLSTTSGQRPPPRFNHGLTSLPGYLYVFGGQSSPVCEFIQFSGIAESNSKHCVISDWMTNGNFSTRFIVTQILCAALRNDLYRLDLETLEWTLLER
jgi:hypothetical protein